MQHFESFIKFLTALISPLRHLSLHYMPVTLSPAHSSLIKFLMQPANSILPHKNKQAARQTPQASTLCYQWQAIRQPSNQLIPDAKQLGHECPRGLWMMLDGGLAVAFLWTEGDLSVLSFGLKTESCHTAAAHPIDYTENDMTVTVSFQGTNHKWIRLNC